MAGPLAGILVISLEQAVAAPLCTLRLAEAGARVIKIERAEGDFARRYDAVVDGESAYFVWLNRGKESLVLDIKDRGDRALLDRLIGRADVFVQNLAPGAAMRAGLGSAALRARHERLITVDISGYGEDGRFRDRKAYDLLIQSETGLAAITGSPEQPGRVGLHHPGIAPYGAYRCGDGRGILFSIQKTSARGAGSAARSFAMRGLPRTHGSRPSPIAAPIAKRLMRSSRASSAG